MTADQSPLLYHAAPSYFSMIARLALTEAGIPFQARAIDIHRRRENQAPWYVRLNPQMTVPTLVLGERVLPDSRLILDHAFPGHGEGPQAALVDLLYGYPVDAFTFSWLMRWNPVARRVVPRKLARIRDDMLALAAENPDLAETYRRRAALFDERATAFAEPPSRRWPALLARAELMLDAIAQELDGRPLLGGERFGAADTVATVFLARMQFCGQRRLVEARPALAVYRDRVRARDSYTRADIWDRFGPGLLLRLVR